MIKTFKSEYGIKYFAKDDNRGGIDPPSCLTWQQSPLARQARKLQDKTSGQEDSGALCRSVGIRGGEFVFRNRRRPKEKRDYRKCIKDQQKQEKETIDYIVLHCPITKHGGGYDDARKTADDRLTNFTDNFTVEV
ncbi:hypothetical protein ElyMa_000649800 [Elysia marginata]|uniref:Uncharacterized protein n=1 Tax=Elysia marginata TaxID=1093978 RepID=A0AAV4GCF3_9GAST|nr:hypothetical protein ElyMa_000649800 [Elysia marginata]